MIASSNVRIMTKIIKCSFIKYGIKFYLSILKKTVNKALNLGREYMLISDDKIKIIKHCCTMRFLIKKGVSDNLDNPRGTYVGARYAT